MRYNIAVFTLETPLARISGIGPRFSKKLEKLGLHTIRDLLWHFPLRYEDFSEIYSIRDLAPGQHATIQACVEDINMRRSWKRRITIIEATLSDGTDTIRAVWFNQPYIKNVLRPGRWVSLAGKVSSSEHDIYFNNPTYELIPLGKEPQIDGEGHEEQIASSLHTGRLVSIYPETRGLTSKGIRSFVQPILSNLPNIPDFLPEEILKEHHFPSLLKALHLIHLPQTLEEAERARERFTFEDLFLLQLFNIQQKEALAKKEAPVILSDIPYVKAILPLLPFELTPSQKKSLWEIIQNMEEPHPMNRLFQGDVGSGKTVVAVLAALLAAHRGFQSAFMAPTEVLARQHFRTIQKVLTRIEHESKGHLTIPSVGLITGSGAKIFFGSGLESDISKKEMAQKIARGEIGIALGTHALIEKSVVFKNIGLVVIDEQHRFGVKQRARLAGHLEGSSHAGVIPHFLSMSATPIPRTLMMTIFGDLDLSLITELPAGRKKIITKAVPPSDRAATYTFIQKEVAQGRQAFVICPRIEKSGDEKAPASLFRDPFALEVRSVKEEYEKLSNTIFPALRVAMLHGQMKSKEKEEIMRAFHNGETDILVSTSVIEVGVDVPNASIMLIEGSERFGLAQLYQFRGRVGRGEHQSYCFLFTDSESQSTATRMKAIVEAKNGFELAEKDLALRGPGEFLGEAQTGLPDYAMQSLQNATLIKKSRDAAMQIIKKDPSLHLYAPLKSRIEEFSLQLHLE
jgi:ATP-dependent DNA helicase RecG